MSIDTLPPDRREIAAAASEFIIHLEQGLGLSAARACDEARYDESEESPEL